MNAGSTSQNATRFSLATDRALPLPCPPTPTIRDVQHRARRGDSPFRRARGAERSSGNGRRACAESDFAGVSTTNSRRVISCHCIMALRCCHPGFHVTACHRRNELVQPLRRKRERLALLGALIRRHEHFHNLESVVERQPRLFLAEKDAHEMAILGLVAVGRRLVGDDRHQPHLGVLLLDEIFALLAAHLAREEQLESAVERVPRHRVLGPEQLGRQPQSGADEAPRRRRFADDRLSVVRLELDRRAGEILRRASSRSPRRCRIVFASCLA